MKFSEAEKALKAGKKIKLPKWEKAYWYMRMSRRTSTNLQVR